MESDGYGVTTVPVIIVAAFADGLVANDLGCLSRDRRAAGSVA